MSNTFEKLKSDEGQELIQNIRTQCKKFVDFAFHKLLLPPKENAGYSILLFSLSKKLLTHCYTLFFISEGTPISEQKKVYDKDSIFSLLRIIKENYLSFYFIFILPETIEEKYFRYYIFSYSEYKNQLSKRKDLFNDPEIIENYQQNPLFDIQREEILTKSMEERLDQYKGLLENNPFYSSLVAKQKDKIFNKYSEWKIYGGWHWIAEKAFF